MSVEQDSTDEAIKSLQVLIDAEFTKQDAATLKEVVLWWTRFRGAMALGGALGSVAKWALLMAAFLAAAKAGALEWLFSGGLK